MSGHLFTAKLQPATFIVDHSDDPPMVFQNPPRSLVRCGKCNRRRWAEHAQAQAYYDGIRYWCAPGHGCKKGKRR